MRKPRQNFFAGCLQRVDAQIKRRPARHGGCLRHALVAEYLCQVSVEPFRIVAGNMRRRVLDRPRRERGALGLAQWRRRKTPAVTERRDRIDIHAALALQHAEHTRARRVVVHDPCARRATPQHVPDQAGDRGAIA
jgi:hypothetical protein